MKSSDNKRKFEEILFQTGRSIKPKADFEKWCRENPQAVNALKSHAEEKETKKQTQFWRIIMKSKVTKLAAVAAIIIAIALSLDIFNSTNAWAEVIKAIENISNVHVTSYFVRGNNREDTSEIWIRRYDGIREECQKSAIIDNGKTRLYLNKEKMEAQVSDSWLKDEPVTNHHLFKEIQMFRKNYNKDITISKVSEESSDDILVFLVKYKHLTDSTGKSIEVSGKAWIDATSMLPISVEAELKGQAEPNEPQSAFLTFDYEPIDDSIFSIEIPEGYKELPRKESGFITGKVIDENGNPVEDAIVVIGDKREFSCEEIRTNENGDFSIKMSPLVNKRPMFPFMIRAYREDDPFKVAWTTIKRPDDNTDYKLEIPGTAGFVSGDGFCKEANGIVLKMEPAGIIFGQVTDENNLPVANARVWIQFYQFYENAGESYFYIETGNLGGTGRQATASVITDSEGNYEIKNIPRFFDKTQFMLRADVDDFVMDKKSFRTDGPLDEKEINFILYGDTIMIKGSVKDNYGNFLDERYIEVHGNGKQYPSCRTKTDANGTFKIERCPSIDGIEITAELNHNSCPSHFPEKFKSFVYYPPVTKKNNLERGKKDYEIELIAERPEIFLNVTVKNTSGKILSYFPVEIRAPGITTQWKIEKRFIQLTDEYGNCKITEVPNIKELSIILYPGNKILNENLDEKTQEMSEEYKENYFWNEIPVNITQGQKEYNMVVEALTHKEYELKQQMEK